ncbi:TIR domain-containing protein [Frankia sp. AgB1.9]|uniref:TIR domain-containing protein n=1 Tax=unclassified Frankia TaxID=2632575 RepID=UPI0019334121|nr:MULTISPECIES: TIR domain-containing protein [unclassified Frankia]MBL7487219.1 TIR domain-containing protein [Frankia sp. AgW1.1]MBL7547965.1 TIR domain-containing protein [Frankia sp. AgB1.9]MBL7625042.1 TIR domain-containing protein [Frankia sp. AgB1.8]
MTREGDVDRALAGDDGRQPDFLVNYVETVGADRLWAEWIAWQLAAAGLWPLVEAWDAVPGSSRVSWFDHAIQVAQRTLVVVSPEALAARGAVATWEAAFRSDPDGSGRRLIPVKVRPSTLPGVLGGLVAIDLAGLDEQEAAETLAAGVEAAINGTARPRTEPMFPGTADAPAGAGPSFPGPQLPDKLVELLNRVTEAYLERFPDAAVTRAVSPDGLRYLEILARVDGEPRRWTVGVHAGDLDEAVLARFLAEVHAPRLETDELAESELVYDGVITDGQLRVRARRRGVEVASLRAVERGWDPAEYRARQAALLAADQVYPPELYVPQRYVRFDEPPGSPAHADVFGAVVDWLDTRDARLVLVLADFGHGKTFLTRELARRVPLLLPQLTPMLISLQTYEKSHNLDTVLAVHLQESGEDSVSARAVRRMLDRGQILLIFDGFDELAIRLTYDGAVEHLNMIFSAVSGRAKVIVTSRTQHFASDEQWRAALRAEDQRRSGPPVRPGQPWLTALGAQVQLFPAARTIRLTGFDEDQILEFLTRHYAHAGETAPGGAARRRLDLLAGVADLRGLSSTPRMLAFIADLAEVDLLAARATGGQMTQADLYRLLVDRWLTLETGRRRPTRGSMPTLSTSQLAIAARAVALRLWTSRADGLDLASLATVVDQTFPELGPTTLDPAQAVFTIGSGSLLIRDEADRFRFVHSSVLEYLVAVTAADQITATGDSPALREREMSTLIVDFLIGAANRTALERWARAILGERFAPEGRAAAAGLPSGIQAEPQRASPGAAAIVGARPERGGTARANALAVASRLGLRELPVDLAGQDLRGVDLSGRVLRGANLRGANLSGVRLSDVDLTDADLTDADLTSAYLVRPRLHRTRLTGSRWRDAALLAPDLDEQARAAAELVPAAMTGRDPVRVWRLPPAESQWSRVEALEWSPDGTMLAIDRATDTVIATADLRPVQVMAGHPAFTPDGSLLAVDLGAGVIRRWDARGGERVRKLAGYAGLLSRWALSPDRAVLATVTYPRTASWPRDQDYTFRLWNAVTGEQAHQSTGVRFSAIAFTPDGRMLAGARDNEAIQLWDTATGRQVRQFVDLPGSVDAMTFSPNGSVLAVTGTNTVALWRVADGRRIRTVTVGRLLGAGTVNAVAFSPDGGVLAAVSNDRSVRLWDSGTGRRLRRLTGHTNRVGAAAFTPDGGTLATGDVDGTTILWNPATGRKVRQLTGPGGVVNAVAFAPDGRTLATAGGDRTIRLWDTATGRQVRQLSGRLGAVTTLAFGPDGATLVSGDHDDAVILWNAATGRRIRDFDGGVGWVTSVAVAPDGNTIAAKTNIGQVNLWNADTGSVIRSISFTAVDTPDPLVFTSDGRFVLRGSRYLQAADVATGTRANLLAESTGEVRKVAFASRGDTFATADEDDGVVWLWSATTAKRIRRLAGKSRAVNRMALSPDGDTLAIADGGPGIQLWHTATGEQAHQLAHPTGMVESVAFSPDGGTVATGSRDGTAILWDVGSGTRVATLTGLADGAWAVLLPDGSYKLSGDAGQELWWTLGKLRFSAGELDHLDPSIRRLAPDSPLPRPVTNTPDGTKSRSTPRRRRNS